MLLHQSGHWFLSILTFSFNAILVLYCKPSNPQHLLNCTHIQFCLSALQLKRYSHSTAATLLLSVPSKVTGTMQLFLTLTKLLSYCACKQEENGGNKSEDLQLKFERAGEDFPHSQWWLVGQLAQLHQGRTKPPQAILAWQQRIRKCFTT